VAGLGSISLDSGSIRLPGAFAGFHARCKRVSGTLAVFSTPSGICDDNKQGPRAITWTCWTLSYKRCTVFVHGQLYVALSRATNQDTIHVLLDNSEEGIQGRTKNIVASTASAHDLLAYFPQRLQPLFRNCPFRRGARVPCPSRSAHSPIGLESGHTDHTYASGVLIRFFPMRLIS
jgi:hypothetical protein